MAAVVQLVRHRADWRVLHHTVTHAPVTGEAVSPSGVQKDMLAPPADSSKVTPLPEEKAVPEKAVSESSSAKSLADKDANDASNSTAVSPVQETVEQPIVSRTAPEEELQPSNEELETASKELETSTDESKIAVDAAELGSQKSKEIESAGVPHGNNANSTPAWFESWLDPGLLLWLLPIVLLLWVWRWFSSLTPGYYDTSKNSGQAWAPDNEAHPYEQALRDEKALGENNLGADEEALDDENAIRDQASEEETGILPQSAENFSDTVTNDGYSDVEFSEQATLTDETDYFAQEQREDLEQDLNEPPSEDVDDRPNGFDDEFTEPEELPEEF